MQVVSFSERHRIATAALPASYHYISTKRMRKALQLNRAVIRAVIRASHVERTGPVLVAVGLSGRALPGVSHEQQPVQRPLPTEILA